MVNAYENKIDHKIIVDNSYLNEMNFAGNDKLVFGGYPDGDDRKIAVYDIVNQQIIYEFDASGKFTTSADGRLFVAADNDGKIAVLIYDINTGKSIGVIENVCRSGFTIESLKMNDNANELVIVDRHDSPGNNGTNGIYQEIVRYDLNTFMPVQTLQNKARWVMIYDDYFQWSSKNTLLGSRRIDFNEAKIGPSHLGSFAVDQRAGKLYRVYKGGEVRRNGIIFADIEAEEQGIVCETLDYKAEFFRVKLDVAFDHIRLNSSTNELLLWKNGASTFARFDIGTQKLKEDSSPGFASSPYQLFFKGNHELIVEESSYFHTYDLATGISNGKFYFDKNTVGNRAKSFLINNERSVLTGGVQDGKAYILNLENGEKVKSIGAGYLDGGADSYGLETIHVNKHADLVALKLSYEDKLAVHKISSGEKIFSLKSDGWKTGGGQNVHVQFNDSGTLMYLGDYGDSSEAMSYSGIYNLYSGMKSSFKLKNGKSLRMTYNLVVNERANLVFMKAFDDETISAGIWDATTGKCVKEIKSSDDFEVMQGFKSSKIPVKGISDDGQYLLTVNGAYDIDNDRFIWNWQNTSDGLKSSGTTIIDETQSTIVNVSYDLITVKDMLSGETLKQFRLVLPEDKSASSITGGIWSSAINKLVLKFKEPEVWILDLG